MAACLVGWWWWWRRWKIAMVGCEVVKVVVVVWVMEVLIVHDLENFVMQLIDY